MKTPDKPLLSNGYGRAAQDLIALKRFEDAQANIQAGLEEFPDQLNLLTIATDVYRASGDREKSLEYSELLITHHPENWNGYGRAAQDLIALKRFEDAQARIQAGLEKLPNQLNLLVIATDVYRASGDREKSLEYSELLITHHPDKLTGYIRAVQNLTKLKRLDEAVVVVNRGLGEIPYDIDMIILGSNTYRQANKFKDSINLCQIALQKCLGNRWYWHERISNDYTQLGASNKSEKHQKQFEKNFFQATQPTWRTSETRKSSEDQIIPDKTLFILAGCSGSGKSTLLKAFSEKYLEVFFAQGSGAIEGLPTSHLKQFFDRPENSIDDWSKNLDDPSKNIYSTHQIPQLKESDCLQKEVILHVDLRDLIKQHFYISDALKTQSSHQSDRSPRADQDILSNTANRMIINLLLNDTFFENFSDVYVTTLFLEFDENQKRYEKRCRSQFNIEHNLFELPPKLAKQAHSSIYYAWLEEITSLQPTGNSLIIEKNKCYIFEEIRNKNTYAFVKN